MTWAPGANRTHLFADPLHPTGAGHEMIAEVVTATLAAPLQASLAGEAGAAAAALHGRAVAAERAAAPVGTVGEWRIWTAARFGRRTVDAPPRLGEAETDLRAVTVGAETLASPGLSWGAAVTFGRHDIDLDGAGFDGDTAVGSLHGGWSRGAFQLSGALKLGRSRMDTERSIRLGPAARVERGATSANLFGVDAELGWTAQETESLRHGPMLGLSWLDQEVDGWRESGESATAMNFSAFERGSLTLRAGYRVTGLLDAQGVALRPRLGVFWEREFEDDPVSVSAGSNAMAGRFSASGFHPPRQWTGVDLGVSAVLDEQIDLALGYSGRYGENGRNDHLANIALHVAF